MAGRCDYLWSEVGTDRRAVLRWPPGTGPQPSRRQFDGKRDSVQPTAHRKNLVGIGLSEIESWVRGGGPVDESCTASHSRISSAVAPPEDARESDGTLYNDSPSIRRGSWLVARILTLGHVFSNRSASFALPSMRCSQLSRTMSRDRSLRTSTSVSVTGRPGSSMTPKTRATSPATKPSSASGARSTKQTPSPESSTVSAANWIASRVFPDLRPQSGLPFGNR